MEDIDEIKRRKLKEWMQRLSNSSGVKSRKVRLCIPTMGYKGLDEQVSQHFGRAPTFTIVDLATNDVKVLPNRSLHMGGSGYPPEIMAKAGVEVMLCSGLGPRAIHMFEGFGIEVYVGAYGTVRDTLRAWQAGKLQMATDENACRMHRH